MSRMSAHSCSGRSIRAAILAAALALLLQSLAPPGYMAGRLSDGWPVLLCPEGLPVGFLRRHHDHGESTESPMRGDRSLGGYCPLGGMLDGSIAVVLPGVTAASQAAKPVLLAHYPAPRVPSRFPAHRSRAPPSLI
jgi:hypothetical protein